MGTILLKQKDFVLSIDMADQVKRRRGGARKYTFRGLELDDLLVLSTDALHDLFRSRIRRKLNRSKGFKGKYLKLLTKLRIKEESSTRRETTNGQNPFEKLYSYPRNDWVNRRRLHRKYKPVEVKFDMIGKYLGEF